MPITITMPALSPTMTEGTLAKWLVAEGGAIAPGDVIAEIETDKATMEVEAVDEGVLARILVAEGSEGVAINTPIAIILEDGEDASALDDYAPAAGTAAAPPTEALPEESPAEVAVAAASTTGEATAMATAEAPARAGRVAASPLAKRLAAQAGLDLASIVGSGPNGRIVKADVEAAIQAAPVAAAAAAPPTPTAAPATAAAPVPAPAVPISAEAAALEPPFELEPHSGIRKTIARRLTEAKQTVPHFYMTVDCELDALLALRAELNQRANGAFKLSVNDLLVKAVAVALAKVPTANVSYAEDGLKRYRRADVSVAVATDRGLITPIVRDAGGKGLEAISAETRALAEKARDGKLMPEEYQGGTFTISNLGMYGIRQFDAVINPPQACILAVGAGEQRPVVKDGALATATVMSCTLSVDHRAVDGAIGAEFLAAFKGLVQDPMTMLL
jgi:pyruvate dehydrogenase E2 component (dihydrolipoamide acetyltransferase)